MSAWQLTASAESDLQDIFEFIASRDGVDRALSVHDKFVEVFELLAERPRIGSVRDDLLGERVRWWRVFDFLVQYDAEASPMIVLRIIHGSRDIERFLH